MGRELQKKKNRSSTNKVKHRPKSKKLNIRGNPLVAANWDKSLSLIQNYRRLGLTSKVNARTGGTERLASDVSSIKQPATAQQDALSVVPRTTKTIMPSEIRIVRDPATGAILRVIRPLEERSNPLNDPLNDISDDEVVVAAPSHASQGIVKELEEQAARGVNDRPRHQSGREEEWIAALVAKYSDDYGATDQQMENKSWEKWASRDGEMNIANSTDKDLTPIPWGAVNATSSHDDSLANRPIVDSIDLFRAQESKMHPPALNATYGMLSNPFMDSSGDSIPHILQAFVLVSDGRPCAFVRNIRERCYQERFWRRRMASPARNAA